MNFGLDLTERLGRHSALHDLQELLDLLILLRELADDACGVVAVTEPGDIASLLIPILFAVLTRSVRVFDQFIQIVYLGLDVLGIVA